MECVSKRECACASVKKVHICICTYVCANICSFVGFSPFVVVLVFISVVTCMFMIKCILTFILGILLVSICI